MVKLTRERGNDNIPRIRSTMAKTSSFFLLLTLICVSGTPVRGQIPGYQVGSLSSLIPTSTCPDNTQGAGGEMSIINRYGPCSPFAASFPRNVSRLLHQDLERMLAIDGKLLYLSTPPPGGNPSWAQASLPVQQEPGVGEFLVTIRLGTPTVTQVLAFDTGSDLTWVQCQPCGLSCNDNPSPIFDPAGSASYKPLQCADPLCRNITGSLGCDTTNRCAFKLMYGDLSSTLGIVGTDVLTLTPSDIFPNFLFGCAQDHSNAFRGISGLLGLANSRDSAARQVSLRFGRAFSYCLPTLPTLRGHLTFGAPPASPSLRYTPMLINKPYFYFLELTGISVMGNMLQVPPAVFATPGTIIDSGSTLTYLPSIAYEALRAAFRGGMGGYELAPPMEGLDTCYKMTAVGNVTVPGVALHFGGGVVVTLGLPGVLTAFDASTVCLAFAAKSNPSGVNIIGNTQQRGMEVVYDLTNARVGFGPGSCGA